VRSADPNAVRYNGMVDCYRKIYKANGIPGFWVGIIPNIMRNSVINAAEIASYDQYKQLFLQKTRMPDNVYLHFICGFMSGFTATCFGSPFDVIKTRMMSNPTSYTGVVDCVGQTIRNEGFLAFYSGFTANFMRIGTWNIAMFITLEKIKSILFPQPTQ
jgi:solute carrier family 25 uncoupling protein 8/9